MDLGVAFESPSVDDLRPFCNASTLSLPGRRKGVSGRHSIIEADPAPRRDRRRGREPRRDQLPFGRRLLASRYAAFSGRRFRSS